MSDVENTALTGAEAATAEAPQEQQDAQVSATEQVDTQEQQDRARDDKGRYVPQERVNEITKARRTAERERDEALRRAQELEQRLSSTTQGFAATDDTAPTLEQYGWDHAKWAQAITEHATRTAITQAEKRLRDQERAKSMQEIESKFEDRARAYAAAHPDYDRAMAELGASVRLQNEVIESIGLSEHGPAIVHHLAQHLDVADRISRLPAHLAAVEIGRIEAKVSAPKPKPVTQAPLPGQTLSGGSSAQKGIRPGMSYEEYKSARTGS